MGSEAALPEWAKKPCIMGIDEAGRGPVLGPMVYGCLYCACSYQKTLATLNFADEKSKFDELVEDKGVKILIDPKALMRVIGTNMDFVDDKLRKNKKGNQGESSNEQPNKASQPIRPIQLE